MQKVPLDISIFPHFHSGDFLSFLFSSVSLYTCINLLQTSYILNFTMQKFSSVVEDSWQQLQSVKFQTYRFILALVFCFSISWSQSYQLLFLFFPSQRAEMINFKGQFIWIFHPMRRSLINHDDSWLFEVIPNHTLQWQMLCWSIF